jgi:hypothetical protein
MLSQYTYFMFIYVNIILIELFLDSGVILTIKT